MQLRNYIVADLRRADTAAILEMYKMKWLLGIKITGQSKTAVN